LRFQKKKVSARATAVVLALGVVGVLATALPAWATTPNVTGVSPTSGVRGTPMTITGTSFNTPATTSVTIGGAAATFVIVNDNSITTTVPCAAPTGLGDVIVNNGTASTNTAADDFTVSAAAAPTITSFTPAAGPVGTVVTITGTNFCGATQVLFNATIATSYTVVSGTTITATVPVGATTGLIHVTTPVLPAASSATNFGVGAGPTITSFSPTSGSPGTSVTITGTNLTGVTSVKFNGTTAVFTPSTATSVTATVPAGATTGKITVTTPVATATSATDFTVGTAVKKHQRSVNLKLKGSMTASGTVKVADGFNACRSNVTVEIQRLKNGTWTKVGSDKTTSDGKYKKALEDKSGKYRAIAKKKTLNGGNDICVADTSPTVKYTHS
jgi:hypothetical protein